MRLFLGIIFISNELSVGADVMVGTVVWEGVAIFITGFCVGIGEVVASGVEVGEFVGNNQDISDPDVGVGVKVLSG